MPNKKYSPALIIILIILACLIIGLISFRLLQNDKLTSQGLYLVPNLMSSYISTNKQPPEKLSDINVLNPYFTDAYIAIKLNMIEYQPIGIQSEATTYSPSVKFFYYEVCGNFLSSLDHRPKLTGTNLEVHDRFYEQQKTGYSQFAPNYFSHPKGRACYKFKEPIDQ